MTSMSTKALKLRMKNSLRTFPIDDSLFNHFLIEAIKIIQVLNSIPVASRLSGTKKTFRSGFFHFRRCYSTACVGFVIVFGVFTTVEVNGKFHGEMIFVQFCVRSPGFVEFWPVPKVISSHSNYVSVS